jgi:hypothetical protein
MDCIIGKLYGGPDLLHPCLKLEAVTSPQHLETVHDPHRSRRNIVTSLHELGERLP